MKNKVLGIIAGILTGIFLILVILIILVLGNRIRTLEETKESLEKRLEEECQTQEELNNVITDLQTSLGEMESEAQAAAQEAARMVNINELPAGTVLTEDQIDQEQLTQYFLINTISDEVYQRINGKSYRENNNIGLDDLRYLKLIHYNFEHQIQVGELIVNAALAQEMTEIFMELFQNEYEIYSMYLVDNYWTGDGGTTDSASIDVNNTSAFNYRTATGSSTNLSNHAYGCAIDINPQQNPYVSYRSGSPSWSHENANDYIDRTTGYAHVITHDDLCYKIFKDHGFSWGGDWNTIKDYQHFEKEVY